MSNRNTKLVGLACWGAWVGLIGGLSGIGSLGIGFLDRFQSPGLEVLEVVPVAVGSIKKYPLESIGSIEVEGVSLILRVRTRGREASIAAVDAMGKLYLDSSEAYYFIARESKENIEREEREALIAKRKPYYRVFWSAWPENGHIPTRIERFEERYVKFTFMEPELLNGQIFRENQAQYVGFEDGFKEPIRKLTQVSVNKFFKQRVVGDKDLPVQQQKRVSYDVRDELKSGILVLQVRVGSKHLNVDPGHIGEVLHVAERDWKERSAQELSSNRI